MNIHRWSWNRYGQAIWFPPPPRDQRADLLRSIGLHLWGTFRIFSRISIFSNSTFIFNLCSDTDDPQIWFLFGSDFSSTCGYSTPGGDARAAANVFSGFLVWVWVVLIFLSIMFSNDLIKYFLVLTRTRVILFVTRAQLRFLFHTLSHTHTDSFQVFIC